MREVKSMIEFKQIIGRGTRLYEGKQTPATSFLIKLSSANYSINQLTLCEMTWRKLGLEKAKLP